MSGPSALVRCRPASLRESCEMAAQLMSLDQAKPATPRRDRPTGTDRSHPRLAETRSYDSSS